MTQKSIQEMDIDELDAEQAHMEKLLDDMFSDEEFEGHGGAPGEWMVERLNEIATARKRLET